MTIRNLSGKIDQGRAEKNQRDSKQYGNSSLMWEFEKCGDEGYNHK